MTKKLGKTHKRNTGPMRSSLRCGAKTRSGARCRSPAVSGKKRCRMHGGAKGSGAPAGNRNAFKHGDYTKQYLDMLRKNRALVRTCREMLLDFY